MTHSPKTKHPAQFTPAIVDAIVERLGDRRGLLLDPFAGPGRALPRFVAPGRTVRGIELEKAWSQAGAPLVRWGDSTRTGMRARSVATFVTSCTYGNRFADHHKAKDGSTRRSYTHDLRAMLDDPDYELDANNTGLYLFGAKAGKYESLHEAVWAEMTRIARDDALFLLNVSDFYKGDVLQEVVQWHIETLGALGWKPQWHVSIATPRMRYGANSAKRVDSEQLIEFHLPRGKQCRSRK